MNEQSLDWAVYLAEEERMKADMGLYIEECVLLSEGTNLIEGYQLINEGIIGSIKAFIHRIMEALGKVWGKFKVAVDTLVKDNQKFLVKYKDIIVGKALKGESWTMYPYQTGLVLNTKIRPLNVDTDPTEEREYATKSYGQLFQGLGENDDIAEFAKNKFRGGDEEEEVSTKQINMRTIYEFCVGYDAMVKTMNSDMQIMQESGNLALKTLNSAKFADQNAKEANSGNDKQEDTGGGDKDDKVAPGPTGATGTYKGSTQPGTSAKKTGGPSAAAAEGFLYSSVYGCRVDDLILEVSRNKAAAGTPDNATAGGMDREGAVKANAAKDATISGQAGNDSELEAIEKRIKAYTTVNNHVIGAKLSTVQMAYKDYMTIIRTHVSDYAGDKGNDGQGLGNQNKNVAPPATEKVKPIT
jgi:hypothetical protein